MATALGAIELIAGEHGVGAGYFLRGEGPRLRLHLVSLGVLAGIAILVPVSPSPAMRIMTDRTSMARLTVPGRSAIEANQSRMWSTAMASTIQAPVVAPITKQRTGRRLHTDWLVGFTHQKDPFGPFPSPIPDRTPLLADIVLHPLNQNIPGETGRGQDQSCPSLP